MKKLLLMLCCCALTLVGTTAPVAGAAAPEAKVALQARTQEYGSLQSISGQNESLYYYLQYPQVENGTLDKEIKGWADSIFSNAIEEMSCLHKEDPSIVGELNVQYDSYQLGRYAGIIEHVFFSGAHLANPSESVRIFNIDIDNNSFLRNNQILDPEGMADILSLLKTKLLALEPGAKASLDAMDERWLDYLILRKDGVDIVLPKGEYLPSVYQTLTVSLTREELGKAYILPEEYKIDPDKPMIALTFDDGPSDYTPSILKLLEENGARGTFCTVGNRVKGYSDTVAQAVAQGCEVIGHSWDHKDLTRLTAQQIRQELKSTNKALKEAAGVEPVIFRPPYGAINDRLKSVAKEEGMALLYWSIDPEDWRTRDADATYKHIMSHVKNGSIILCHDLYKATAKAMERVIPELVEQGYQLVTVSDLLSYNGGTVPGQVYYHGAYDK